MSFDDLPPMPAMLHPGASEYASIALEKSRAAAAKHRCIADQAYGMDRRQRLDLYFPESDPQPGATLPVLVYFHGGAWMNGFKEWMGFLASGLVDHPLILACPSYRLAPAVGIADIVRDGLEALAWVYRNIRCFGGDPGRIHLGGHSAGGQLASLITLRPDLLKQCGLPSGVVKACFPTSSAYDFSYVLAPATPADQRIGEALGPDVDGWSPIHFVTGNRIPFHVLWGENDLPRISAQSAQFVQAMREQGAPVTSQVLPGHDHFTTHIASASPMSDWTRTVRRMITEASGGTGC